jgi:TRAP-type mannitol/chloroaromatic compound transport system permease small subunit
MILPLVFSLAYEVFARYIINRPTTWSFDTSYMLLTAIFFPGAAYALIEGAHIRIDFLYLKFSRKIQAIIDLAGYLIIFIPVIFVIAYASVEQAIYAYKSSELSDLSPWRPMMWPFRVTMAIGFVLLAIQGVVEIMKNLIKFIGRQDGGKNG